MRRLLGWDDDSLHRFIASPMIVHSATHVSMNSFAPMLTFPWFCHTLVESAARRGVAATHVRTQVTHNNLSDNRWKPHVWWRVDVGGRVRCTRLFSKARRFEHQILLCQPVPDIPRDDLADADADAVDLAGHMTNFAYFAMAYRLGLERRLGFHTADSTVEVPIDLMNVFSLRDALPRWSEALYAMELPLRGIEPDNELRFLTASDALERRDPLDVRDTLISHNYINVGHAYRLGPSVTMGAEKMSVYEAEMNRVLAAFFSAIGESGRFPGFLGVRRVDLAALAPLEDRIQSELDELGGRPSLPLYAADPDGGALRKALDAALDQPVGGPVDLVTRAAAGAY
ncbi:hypothetical protein AB0K16_45235 [Nonomuraea jabiensis]|uniref:hypothetical protein n=1 Tax=Nonomuraea jabiensis TaxID=882448 RepID=UPI0034250BFE